MCRWRDGRFIGGNPQTPGVHQKTGGQHGCQHDALSSTRYRVIASRRSFVVQTQQRRWARQRSAEKDKRPSILANNVTPRIDSRSPTVPNSMMS